MRLKSLNSYISLLILICLSFPAFAEEEIDIWNKEKKIPESSQLEETNTNSPPGSQIINKLKTNNEIKIENEILDNSKERKIFGIYDPSENDFNLNMWSQTDYENVKSSVNRIKKIKLSKTATDLFEKTIFTFAYPPAGMSEEEFIDLKINWMVENKRIELIEKFLNQNATFYNKKKVIQYLVDDNISKANLKEGCKKIKFLDKSIKDSYLEKFKIYCLVFEDRKNEAQLLYDILKEQKQSDNFFDDKINYLLGINDKTSNKVRDDSLLNFFLSSITIKDFKYEPNKKTKKIIWEYMNAANLIQLEDVEDKQKLKKLEIAANRNQLDKQKIFDIYAKINFDLTSLINAENIYQTLDGTDSRALIYQKFLLSDNIEKKIQLLFLLKDLFKKENFSNLYLEFMSDRLKELDSDEIPKSYKDSVEKNIITDVKIVLKM